MKARLIAAAILSAAMFTDALAEDHEERNIDGLFTAVEVSKGANVTLVQGEKVGLEVVTDGCPTSDVETFVQNGILTVRMKKRTPGSAVQVKVYFKDIDKVTVRRGASAETDGTFKRKGKLTLDVGAKCEAKMDVDVDELEVDASTCTVELEGRAAKQRVFVAGTVGQAKYDAEDLESEDVTIKAVNSVATVKFSGTLDANSVKSTISYVGDDSKVTKSGSGDVVAK